MTSSVEKKRRQSANGEECHKFVDVDG